MANQIYQLKQKILENSLEKSNFLEACKEWKISAYYEDGSQNTECTCGKESLKHVYEINNLSTYNTLIIGSVCINKFERTDLNDNIKIQTLCNVLCNKISGGEFIVIEDFSRKLIDFLWDLEYFDSEKDCSFFKKMFNKKNKEKITTKQESYIRGIIYFQIMKKIKENNNFII